VNPSSSVEEGILDRFQSLMRHVAGSHAPEFLGVDVTMPQAKVLYVVSLRPAMSMSALAAELEVGLPATSGLIDRLVASDYVERREDPSDRRQQLVTITPAGAAALDRLRELRLELMRRLVAGLSPTELQALETALAALDREAQHLDDPATSITAPHERTPA
jgi:DNA-binding MarR family transcriptional regulator